MGAPVTAACTRRTLRSRHPPGCCIYRDPRDQEACLQSPRALREALAETRSGRSRRGPDAWRCRKEVTSGGASACGANALGDPRLEAHRGKRQAGREREAADDWRQRSEDHGVERLDEGLISRRAVRQHSGGGQEYTP